MTEDGQNMSETCSR